MKNKYFKSLEEQIDLLISKGVVVNDYNATRDILLRENYFFVTGYKHIFIKSHTDRVYIDGTTFEEVYAVFNFDRALRNILFKNILIFENNIKSIIAYTISKNYGYTENNYLSNKTFVNDQSRIRQINDLVKKMKRQISVNGRQHSATKHYNETYGYIPLWVVVKVLSFGIIGEFYMVLKNHDKEEIADIFNIDVDNLESYLPILANYRNLCAHEDICYENRTQKAIDDTVYHSLLSINKIDDEYVYGKRDLYALIIILKEVLKREDFDLLMGEINYEISKLDGKLNVVGIRRVLDMMGFPDNYNEIVRMV